MAKPRILLAQLSHESNTFNPVPTGFDAFEACGLYTGDDIIQTFTGTDTELGGMITELTADADPIGALAASAIPSGPVSDDVVDRFIDHIVNFATASPIDGIALALHGSMLDTQGRSCELRLVHELSRAASGVPIVATLDLHTNLPQALVQSTAGLFPYRTNPHVDMHECGVRSVRYLLRTLRQDIDPVQSYCGVPLRLSPLGQGTTQLAMSAVMARASRWEATPGMLTVGVFAGFAFADVPQAGLAVVAATDGDGSLAEEAAADTAAVAWDERQQFVADATIMDMDDVIHRIQKGNGGPIVIAEVADNVNAGTLGEATHLLHALLDGIADVSVVYGVLADRDAVQDAIQSGVGSTLTLDLGGALSPTSGTPVSFAGQVKLVSDGRFTNRYANNGAGMLKGLPTNMGRTVVLENTGSRSRFTIVVSERPIPPIGPEPFQSVGIDVTDFDVIAVKTRAHYWSRYPEVAASYEVATPGMAAPDLLGLAYERSPQTLFPAPGATFHGCSER